MALKDEIQVAQGTREERKQEKNDQKEAKFRIKRRKKIRIRLIPIWLRIIIVAVLLCISVFLGALFGYSVIGDGKGTEVFQKSTWTHIWDLVVKEK